jgi:hypothetical protein
MEFFGAGQDNVTVAVDAFEPAFEAAGVGYGDSQTLIQPFRYYGGSFFVR